MVNKLQKLESTLYIQKLIDEYDGFFGTNCGENEIEEPGIKMPCTKQTINIMIGDKEMCSSTSIHIDLSSNKLKNTEQQFINEFADDLLRATEKRSVLWIDFNVSEGKSDFMIKKLTKSIEDMLYSIPKDYSHPFFDSHKTEVISEDHHEEGESGHFIRVILYLVDNPIQSIQKVSENSYRHDQQ